MLQLPTIYSVPCCSCCKRCNAKYSCFVPVHDHHHQQHVYDNFKCTLIDKSKWTNPSKNSSQTNTFVAFKWMKKCEGERARTHTKQQLIDGYILRNEMHTIFRFDMGFVFFIFVPQQEGIIFFHWCYFDDIAAVATPTSSISHTHDMYKYTWMSRHIRSSIYILTQTALSLSLSVIFAAIISSVHHKIHTSFRKKLKPNGAKLSSPSTIIKYFQSIPFGGRRFWIKRKSHVCSGKISHSS